MGNEQKRMKVFGFLKDEEINNKTMCTSFLLHRSTRVLRGKSVVRKRVLTFKLPSP
jgi:hypothetical protein